MDYKQKYEEALETARKINSGEGVAAPKGWSILEVVFPELKKSKDERIREEILNCFIEMKKQGCFPSKHKEQYDFWVSWLEKQNKQQVRTGNEWVNTIDNACNHRYAEEYAHGEYCHEQSFKWGFQEGVDWLEKHPIFNMPKIKFNVGDWVIFKCGTHESVYKVEKLENYEYTLEHFLGGSMPLPFGSQSLLRPWTIQDAKDGDILTTRLSLEGDWIGIFKERNGESFTTYCFLASDGEFVTNINRCKQHGTQGIHPATKEQRNHLFQKIHEAGYTWDSNKKELIRL